MPAEPAPESFEWSLGVSRDRLVGQPELDVVGQGPGRSVAILWLQGHCLQADGFECFVDRRVELPGPGKLAFPDGAEHGAQVFALDWRLACQQAVEGGAQTVDVAGR